MSKLKAIQEKFIQGEMMDEKAKFMCFGDGMMTYHLERGTVTYEICIICENREFYHEEAMEDLIMLYSENISFLSWRAFQTGTMKLLSEGVPYVNKK